MKHATPLNIWTMATLLATWSSVASAQTPQGQPVEAAPAGEAKQDAPASPVAPPPPGEEVMHPSEHGLRMTPGLARAFAGAITGGMSREFKLNPEQQKKLSDAYARRIMETARTYQEQGQAFGEYAIEAMIKGIGGSDLKFAPETATEFGNRATAVTPAFHELMEGLIKDAQPVLSPKDYAEFQKKMDEGRHGLDEFDQRMQRWGKGGFKEGENPFRDAPDPTPAADPKNNPSPKPRPREIEQAENVADWTLRSTGVTEWTGFLEQIKEHFKFDAQQSAKADKILDDYRAKADAVMTPEWKETMRQNRIKSNLRYRLKGVPTAPWSWRLQHEYDLALKPIREMGWAFRKEILGLLTPQQRESALGEINGQAAQHGLSVEDKDQAVFGLGGGGTWSLWKF